MIYNPSAPDDLLSALSIVGSGKYSVFQNLAKQVYPRADRREELNLFYNFASLGHIDVDLNNELRPQQWNVTSPTICFSNEEEGWLTGFRSPRLGNTIKEVAQGIGVVFDVVYSNDPVGPKSLCLLEDQPDLITKMCGLVNQEMGEDILGYSFNFATRLASSLPTLQSIVKTCQRENGMVPDNIEGPIGIDGKLDSSSGIGLTSPGLYRYYSHASLFYIWFDGEELIKVNNRVGKHMVSKMKNIPAMTYDEDTKTLRCLLGAELPGLYERAAVLSSGRAPVIEDGNSIYKEVSPSVASALYQSLFVN